MKMVIFLFVVFVFIEIIFVSAQEINLDYDDKVEVGEFSIVLELLDFPSGVYDVKIDILGDGERICKINNNGWKSTYYYVQEAIESGNKEEFDFLNENYVGDADIEIKVRKSGGSYVKTFSDYEIEFVKESEDKPVVKKVLVEEESLNESDDKSPIEEIIELSPQNIKRVDSVEGKNKVFSRTFYGLIMFGVLIGLLFMLKFLANFSSRKNDGIA